MGDSIIGAIRVRDFNIVPTLKAGFYERAVLHVGVNDLLNNKSPSSIDILVSNLAKFVNKCNSFGVMDLFVSGIAFNKRLPKTVIKKVNEKIVDMCKKNGKVFLDNGNISNMDLYQDGLHLPERGKCLLAKNFIFVLNIFLNMLTSPFSRYKAPLDCSEKTDLQRLQDLRLHHRKNLLIGYLNINSLRNKISDLRVLLHDLQLEYFVISETKLDDSFPSAQFAIENYKIRARRDRDGHGGGLIRFVKRGINCKRVN